MGGDDHPGCGEQRAGKGLLAAFLGGGLDAEAMAAAVDPQLYRNRASRAAS